MAAHNVPLARTRSMHRVHLAAVLTILTAGCTADEAASDSDAVESGTLYADQGWTPENRGDMYYATQGSQLLPLRWFKALRVAGSDQRFASAAHMAKLGFVTEPVSSENPEGLPPGFAVDGESVG